MRGRSPKVLKVIKEVLGQLKNKVLATFAHPNAFPSYPTNTK